MMKVACGSLQLHYNSSFHDNNIKFGTAWGHCSFKSNQDLSI